MNIAKDKELAIPLLGMDQKTLEKKEIEASKGKMGKLSKTERQIANYGSIMGMSPISNRIWSIKAQSQFIIEVFKEEINKTSQRLDFPQISLMMDELICL